MRAAEAAAGQHGSFAVDVHQHEGAGEAARGEHRAPAHHRRVEADGVDPPADGGRQSVLVQVQPGARA
ncbi:hypothetical protein, partial [Streptomyces sp. NPDC007070]|uniref:hypothetical protein n=1 Tax=Streptomyces sp. NPDC007070 TaxID=3154312 RepID=UPI0033F868F8